MVPTLSKAFEIQRLRVLVEVARLDSVSRAAEALGLTQPTVSLHLKALNDTLGVAVVERQGRGIRLTEAGLLLERHASRALAELERAQQALDDQRDLATGSLRIGAGVSSGTYVLPEVIGEYREQHPSIDIEFEVGTTETISELLKRGELHLGVLGEIAPHPDLEVHALGSDTLVCVVGAGSPLAKQSKISKSDIRGSTLLARSNGSATQAVADKLLAELKVKPATRWGFQTPEAMVRAAGAGLGIAFVSELSSREEIRQGNVVAVEIEGAKSAETAIQIVRSVHHAPSPAERAFVELLEQRLPNGSR
jgi:DNA-binding transcriptional LysR family regulator